MTDLVTTKATCPGVCRAKRKKKKEKHTQNRFQYLERQEFIEQGSGGEAGFSLSSTSEILNLSSRQQLSQ